MTNMMSDNDIDQLEKLIVMLKKHGIYAFEHESLKFNINPVQTAEDPVQRALAGVGDILKGAGIEENPGEMSGIRDPLTGQELTLEEVILYNEANRGY